MRRTLSVSRFLSLARIKAGTKASFPGKPVIRRPKEVQPEGTTSKFCPTFRLVFRPHFSAPSQARGCPAVSHKYRKGG